MMVHRFWTQNDPIALNETFLKKTINTTLTYLLHSSV